MSFVEKNISINSDTDYCAVHLLFHEVEAHDRLELVYGGYN